MSAERVLTEAQLDALEAHVGALEAANLALNATVGELEAENARLRAALTKIAEDGCETFTGDYDCWKAGRDPDSPYGGLNVCLPCHAVRALREGD